MAELFLYDKIPYSTKLMRDRFASKVKAISGVLGCSPDHLMMCLFFESKLRPSFNSRSGTATGMLLIVESWAKKLGTTPKDMASMAGIEQLDYIVQYLERRKGKHNVNTLLELYLAAFYPAALGKSSRYVVRMARRWKEAHKRFPIKPSGDIKKCEIEIALIKYFTDYHGYDS